MNAIAASTTAMNIVANSGTAMNSINNSSTAINIVKASRIAMFYIGKYNSVTTARSNFATTHANITGLNDSLMSAYIAGWLGAAAYSTYTSLAGLIGNNTYLTTLGGNATLMTLINANTAWRTAIIANIAKVIANTAFWTACCGKSNIMNGIAADATAMTTVAANATAMTTVAANTVSMTSMGSYQNSLDKIWAQPDNAVAKVCASSTAIAALVAIQSTVQGFGYAAVNNAQAYSVWHGKKVFIQNGKYLECAYSGAIKSATLPKGTYTLAVWGAQGGHGNNTWNSGQTNWDPDGTSTTWHVGGKGGYSTGTKALSAATTLYLCVGGEGGKHTNSTSSYPAGGYNGGGDSGAKALNARWGWTTHASGGGGGGGATHIGTQNAVLKSCTASNVYIVAGGGGGGGQSWSDTSGTTNPGNDRGGNARPQKFCGGNGGGQYGQGGYVWSWGVLNQPGGPSDGGQGGYVNGNTMDYSLVNNGSNYGAKGGFGIGGVGNHWSSSGWAGGGGGGGGWYGGGGGHEGWSVYAGGGAGGSGYVGGVTSGSMTIGSRTGNGLARITRTA